MGQVIFTVENGAKGKSQTPAETDEKKATAVEDKTNGAKSRESVASAEIEGVEKISPVIAPPTPKKSSKASSSVEPAKSDTDSG